ncbi:hypothetical protein Bpfe_019633 [Biomphalaria pfeifferi]|uniref:Uncharacterized protein n=1 Tax=Biomphalaria pfeifferi TaxID=112525 RepID=A0AAD8BA90_BIOPF|nr:hypothetical protein Bpfe_019633 [Biomphalaria pfeifferi]
MPPKKPRKNLAQKCEPLPEESSGDKERNVVDNYVCKKSSIRKRKPGISMNLGCADRKRSLLINGTFEAKSDPCATKGGTCEGATNQNTSSKVKTTSLTKHVKKEFKGDLYNLQSLAEATLVATLKSSLKDAEEKKRTASPEKLQSILMDQIKSVPSQSWSVNADSLSALRRTSTTLMSQSCLKCGKLCPEKDCGIHKLQMEELICKVPQNKERQLGTDFWVKKDYTPQIISSVEKKVTSCPSGQKSDSRDMTFGISDVKEQISNHHPNAESNKTKVNRLQSDSECSKHDLKYHKDNRSDQEDNNDTDTDLSMVPMKNSVSFECWTLTSQHDTDRSLIDVKKPNCQNTLINTMTHCREYIEQNCFLKSPKTASAMSQRHLEHVPIPHESKKEEIQLNSLRRRALTSNSQIGNDTNELDCSAFTPACHTCEFKAQFKESVTTSVSRSGDESLEVINIRDPTFCTLGDLSSDMKDTSTWMTAAPFDCSRIPRLSSLHEKASAKNIENIEQSDPYEDSSCTTARMASLELSRRQNDIHYKSAERYSRPRKDKANVMGKVKPDLFKASIQCHENEKAKKTSACIAETQTSETVLQKQCYQSAEHLESRKKKIINTIPPEQRVNLMCEKSAHDAVSKRPSLQRPKQNKYIYITKKKPKSSETQGLIKSKKNSPSKRCSSGHTCSEPSYSYVPYLSPQISNAGTPKSRTVRCCQSSPRKKPHDISKLQTCDGSPKELNSVNATSNLLASKEEKKQQSNDKDLKYSAPAQRCKSIDVSKRLSLNACTNTTRSLENCIPEINARKTNKRKLKIRVFAKPSKLKTGKLLLRETHVILPGPGKEDKTYFQKRIKENNVQPSPVVQKEPMVIQSKENQFKSMQEYDSCIKEPAGEGTLVKHKLPKALNSKTNLDQHASINPTPNNVTAAAAVNDDAGATRPSCSSSTTIWEDVICSSFIEHKVISFRKSNSFRKSSLPPSRCPPSQVRSKPVRTVWDHFKLSIDSLLRFSIVILFVLCFLYFIMMLVHNMHTNHFHHA